MQLRRSARSIEGARAVTSRDPIPPSVPRDLMRFNAQFTHHLPYSRVPWMDDGFRGGRSRRR